MVINKIQYAIKQGISDLLVLMIAPVELLAESKFAESPACS